MVKGVLNDSSESVFRGLIKILEKAQNTNSYLSNHSLILSDNAVSNTIPALEIDANEVKASHGATLGRPDDLEIFYLMSRGLSKDKAKKMIVEGYFSPILDSITIDEIKNKFSSSFKQT